MARITETLQTVNRVELTTKNGYFALTDAKDVSNDIVGETSRNSIIFEVGELNEYETVKTAKFAVRVDEFAEFIDKFFEFAKRANI